MLFDRVNVCLNDFFRSIVHSFVYNLFCVESMFFLINKVSNVCETRDQDANKKSYKGEPGFSVQIIIGNELTLHSNFFYPCFNPFLRLSLFKIERYL